MGYSGQVIKNFIVDKLNVNIYSDRKDMGQGVAAAVVSKIQELLNRQEYVSIVFAAAPSQNEFLDCLSTTPGIDWSRVIAFHMDEYIGLPDTHPEMFASYLKGRIFNRVKPGKVFLISGQTSPPDLEIERYTKLLLEYPLDITCMGIGENGHIAFNDPAFADFYDPDWIKLVDLDLTSREQQVHDGCFAKLDDVPVQALTLTIPALISSKWVYCTVPGPTKRKAVQNTLHGPISTTCPASILRQLNNAVLYLDLDSAKDILE